MVTPVQLIGYIKEMAKVKRILAESNIIILYYKIKPTQYKRFDMLVVTFSVIEELLCIDRTRT